MYELGHKAAANDTLFPIGRHANMQSKTLCMMLRKSAISCTGRASVEAKETIASLVV